MQKRWTWMILILISLLALWGCSDDDADPTPVPTQTAFEKMAEVGSAYINDSTSCPGVMAAATLQANLALYTVIDIRAERDFIAGHIAGAYNSSLADLLDDLDSGFIPTDKPFVVACYSGQSAGHAKVALEMLDYECYTLLFGMSAWSSETRTPWDSKTVDADLADRNQLTVPETTDNNDDLVPVAFPVLTESTNSVVRDRVEAMLTGNFKGIPYSTVAANPNNYFVVNYFGRDDYIGDGGSGVPGHVGGAFQFTPYESMGMDQMLENLPTNMPIVVYCWTGQHSSQITAYLNMLGYEAYSMLYGSNVLFYDVLSAHNWTASAYNDFELETGSRPTPAFAAVAEAGKAYVNDSSVCPGVMSAAVLQANLNLYTVIDIRDADDYNAGHITGAVNSELTTLISDLGDGTIPTGKPYVIACYSGQSAGHAKIAMEMLGYDVYSLLYGMSSWSSSTRTPWDSKTVDANMADRNQLTHPETDDNNGDLELNAFPELAGDAASAVADRVDAMLTGNFKGIPYSTVAANPDNYFVINYFGRDDYIGEGGSGVPGHVGGAFQYTPYQSMGWDEMLSNIPTDMPVVVYCWTGQHSSQITAYLNMLGYDAYSMLYGSNVLFYDVLSAHKWTAAAYNDFTLEGAGN